MKKCLPFAVFFFFLISNLKSQIPQKISYQAVIRNSNNFTVNNHLVSIRISLIQGAANGIVLYKEIHKPTTNNIGLISIEIGGGNVLNGNFNLIDWSSGIFFIKTEVDPDGGSNFTLTTVNQLLSVPFSIFSNKAYNGLLRISNNGDTLLFMNGQSFISKNNQPSSNELISIYPLIGSKGTKLPVSFTGGDVINFTQSSNTCPQLWANSILKIYDGSSTFKIEPVDVNYLNNKRFDVIFDLPNYVPSGLYDLILGPGTNCEYRKNGIFKIK